MDGQGDWVTVTGAARIMGVSKDTLYEMIRCRDSRLPPIHKMRPQGGARVQKMLLRQEVERFAQQINPQADVRRAQSKAPAPDMGPLTVDAFCRVMEPQQRTNDSILATLETLIKLHDIVLEQVNSAASMMRRALSEMGVTL